MKGHERIIEGLNQALTIELTAINQYFCQSKMCKNWGYTKLAAKHYTESIGEMKHADKLIERVLMLDGLPNLQALHKLMIGETVPEILHCDLQLEHVSQKTLKEGISVCEQARDYVSRELLEAILDDTEEHIDWLETQMELIEQVGLQNYLQSQMGDA